MMIYDIIKKTVPKLDAEYKISEIINHSASKGTLREFIMKNIIRPFLPKRYGICNGECFDLYGSTSKQMDVIIYDDLFSYAIPIGDYYIMPFESTYGEIEVKSMLNKQTFLESIKNISSFKSLKKETPENCQILPNLSFEIKGVTWNRNGFTKPFGIVFAYNSVAPKTVLNYFHDINHLDPSLMPDMIVLLKEQTIIFRVIYEGDKFYVTDRNTYEGFIPIKCNEDTLPIFLSYILSRTKDTCLKIADTISPLNKMVDKYLHEIDKAPIVKFDKQYNGED